MSPKIILLVFTTALAAAAEPPPPGKLSFNHDVRPILSDKCYHCHGFDPKARKADRRLDTAAGATAELDGIRAIVPGDLEKSDAWQRIIATEKDEVMPPPKAHKPLSAAEKATLKRWIEQGAKYEKHWAFESPQRAAAPVVTNQAWVRNPIDGFVLAGLERAGLQPAAEADRRILARRVALDLTGLPPPPETVEAFVTDPQPDAYEKLVAQLMATPQWGEHRGRYWLDAARYADTHGLHFDNYREIWPYRDWVVAAFNRNLHFDQFTVEQIAGDLLPNPTREQLVATGFHRCNATTSEGGTIDEENLAIYANDRVTTTSWVWLGLTANCAACHDHKFDPITQKDFYAMAAFFRNTTQGPKDRNAKDSKPVMYLPSAADEPRFDQLTKDMAADRAALGQRREPAAKDFELWLSMAKPEQVEVGSSALEIQLPLQEGAGVDIQGEVHGKETAFKATGPIEWRDGGKFGKAPAFINGAHFELGNLADFDHSQAFSVGCWVNLPTGFKNGSIVARMDDSKAEGDDDNKELQGWELFVQDGKFGAQFVARAPAGSLRALTKSKTTGTGKWQHVLATYDGSGAASGFRIFVDGREQPVTTDGKALTGVVRTAVPLRIGQREVKSKIVTGQVQDLRIYTRELTTTEARSLPDEQNLRASFTLAADKRTPAQNASLLNFYIDNFDAPSVAFALRIEQSEDEAKAIQERSTVSHIQEEKPGAAMANIMIRGAYDNLGEKVAPAGFSALPPMPADAPSNRLGLARWLVAPENPLMARVTVNRFWQELFGTGLVKTAEDFGAQGDRPVNPELLDWLAVEFRESGWDVKKLFTLMVTSATYRQAPLITPAKLERDPQNRLLSRGPRFRMDAEMIRDYVLAASGTLSPKMGGAGTRPYQPEHIWDVVGLPGSTTREYKQDSGENLYRRTLYNLWKRQAPSPNMEVFNAPTREQCSVRRERTNTPIQALVTLNDPQFVEAARRLAEAACKQGGEPAAMIAHIARRILLRPLSAAEMAVVEPLAQEFEQAFVADPASANALLAIGESKVDPALPAARLAALSMVASQLFNLDEALNK